jgi:hypothetical protein
VDLGGSEDVDDGRWCYDLKSLFFLRFHHPRVFKDIWMDFFYINDSYFFEQFIGCRPFFKRVANSIGIPCTILFFMYFYWTLDKVQCSLCCDAIAEF